MYDEDLTGSAVVLTAASSTLISSPNFIPYTIAAVLIGVVLLTIVLRIRRSRTSIK